MAGLKEIAIGITTALQFAPEPEPLGIDLWGQTPEEATFLLRAIIDECADGDIPLKKVKIDAEMLRRITANGAMSGYRYRSVSVEPDASLNHRLELYRRD